MSGEQIALDVSAVPAQLTGAGVYTYELARALVETGEVRLTLVSRRSDGPRWAALSPERVVAVAPDSTPLRLAFGELGLSRAVSGKAPPVLLHGPHYTMPARPKMPVVVTVHDLTLLEHPEWHERAKVAYFGHAIRHAARHATRLVCVSAHTAARLEALLAPSCPVEVVPHGVDHARFGPEETEPGADAAVLERLGVPSRYLLHLGTVEPRKNLPLLVRAFDELAGRDGELELVIAGNEAWGRAELDAAVATARHGERIRRLGYVAHADVAALLRGAAVVCYPSKEEGFGLPALEALACGAPLITSADSVMSELAGEAAWCFSGGAAELAAAINEALGAPGSRRTVGLERAAGYTWAACAAGHLAVYRQALR